MSSYSGKVVALIIMVCLLGAVGTMTILGANGSILVFQITKGLADWAQLIALGVAMGIFFFFLPKLKGKF